eukprot:3953117-Pyramimonas_sp.AAC.2
MCDRTFSGSTLAPPGQLHVDGSPQRGQVMGTRGASSGIARPRSERTPSRVTKGWTGFQPRQGNRATDTWSVES